MSEQCEIDFDHYFLSDAGYTGADLVLYKAQEFGEVREYVIYIIHVLDEGAGHLVAFKTLSSDCHGWQVFHLEDAFIRHVRPDKPVKFKIIVSTITFDQLDCSQVSDIFLLTAPTAEEVASGDNEELLSPKPNHFNIQSQRLDYLPTLNVFDVDYDILLPLFGRKRRDIPNIPATTASKNERRCYRVEKVSFLLHDVSDRSYSVIQPLLYDVGECQSIPIGKSGEGTGKVDDKDQDKWLSPNDLCAPTKYKTIPSHISTKDGHQIYWLPDMVIEECGWVNSIQDNTS